MKIKVPSGYRFFQFIIVVLIIMYSVSASDSLFISKYCNWIPLVAATVIMIFISIRDDNKNYIGKIIKVIKLFVLPLIIPTVIATITAWLIYQNSRFTLSSWKFVLFTLGAYAFGLIIIFKFKFEAIYLILFACVCSYLTNIIKFLIVGDKGILEVHELTYIFGMIFIFFLLYEGIEYKKRIILCSICAICIILGGKRAMLLALAVSLIIYFLFYKISKKKNMWLLIMAVSWIILSFAWVWFIRSGNFELLCKKFGINDMSRIKMWNYFKKDYSFSPIYFGRGLSYTDVIMSYDHSKLHISTAIPIHNAILRIYIGWGFIPTLYFLYYYFIRRIICINRQSNKNAWIFMTISIAFFIVNLFGDTIFNSGTSIAYIVLWLILSGNYNFEYDNKGKIRNEK